MAEPRANDDNPPAPATDGPALGGRPRRPRILVVTASVGTGHNQAARAVGEGLAEAAPDADVTCVDVLDHAGRLFRTYYAGGYKALVTRLPRLYGLGYRLTDRPHRPARGLLELRRLLQERVMLHRFADFLRELVPDLILHTHFLAPPLVARLIRTGRLDTRQAVVVTDVAVHRFWYAEEVDRWFVPADRSAEAVGRWGVEPERVCVSGIPVQAKWTPPPDPAAARAARGLPADKPVVLLSGGAEFTCGPVFRVARGLLERCPDATVVVLTGRNEKLHARLARLGDGGGRLRLQGFTDRMPELAAACSLMVTKAGGITTAECLAAGVPMVFLRPVPGQERGNARHFTDRGAAEVATGADDAVRRAAALLGDPARLQRMADQAGDLHRPARRTIASWAASAVRGR